MGYYTKFELTFECDEDIKEKINKYIESDRDKFYGLGDDSYKWYNHEDDMKDLSVKFPDIVFTLYGEGEENEDVWYKYFKNGKMQLDMARLTFDGYSESQLR